AYSARLSRCKRSVCVLTAEQEEGPFYWTTTTKRQNITENKKGVPLRLVITIIDTNNCSAIKNADVELWLCDAGGLYSHYLSGSRDKTDSSTFLRGYQLTGPSGKVKFDLIFPGWYSGRAMHIHLKVHFGGTSTTRYTGGHVAHTGQIFFPDQISHTIANTSPYKSNTVARTLNANDRVYTNQKGSTSKAVVTYVKGSSLSYGLKATITLGVNSLATPSAVGKKKR
ncbi:unnamed protein product, partial [Didymodactylos carnosus]